MVAGVCHHTSAGGMPPMVVALVGCVLAAPSLPPAILLPPLSFAVTVSTSSDDDSTCVSNDQGCNGTIGDFNEFPISHVKRNPMLRNVKRAFGLSANLGEGVSTSAGGQSEAVAASCPVLRAPCVACNTPCELQCSRCHFAHYSSKAYTHTGLQGQPTARCPPPFYNFLLKGDEQGANASYPLHLLLLPHEATFTAGAGSVPATPGRVRA
jgi:hypothetical protein